MLIGPKDNDHYAKDANAQLKANYRPLKLSSNESVKQHRQILEETINLVLHDNMPVPPVDDDSNCNAQDPVAKGNNNDKDDTPSNPSNTTTFLNIDFTTLSDSQLKYILHIASNEQMRRAQAVDPKAKICTFTVSNHHAEYTCIPVPRHKSDKTFTSYQQSKPYIKALCEAVGGKPVGSGKLNRGAERVLTHLAALKEETYMKCGKDRG